MRQWLHYFDLIKRQRRWSYLNQIDCYICKAKIENTDNKNYNKVRDHCHYTGQYRSSWHSRCNLKHKIPKKIPVILHNKWNYDYHSITKELTEEFEGKCECLGESREKYITFPVPIKKEIKNWKVKSVKSVISSESSNLVDNLADKLNERNYIISMTNV